MIRLNSGKRPAMWHLKKMLASLSVVGAVSCFTITGTYAVLSSETRNAGGRISSGTLTFSNKVNVNTACYSYGAGSTGNVNSSCDSLFQNTTLMYPGTAVTQKVTLKNDGSLDGQALSVYMPTCTAVTSPGAPPGGGDPCASGGAQIYIEERDSAFSAGSATCVYPVAVGACILSANTMSYLAGVRNTASSAYPLGNGPVAGASRYFIVGMQLPSGASNALQGEEALFSLTWHLST
ncbi:MAG TPA: hypothetical protein VIL77_15330 [Gaiellaceae bacterium]